MLPWKWWVYYDLSLFIFTSVELIKMYHQPDENSLNSLKIASSFAFMFIRIYEQLKREVQIKTSSAINH